MAWRSVRSAGGRLIRRSPQLRRTVNAVRYSAFRGLPEPFRTVRPYSLLTYLNLFYLQELARRLDADGLEGDFVECGVYQGGSAGVLGFAALASRFQRFLWLYDSFAGMPPASDEDDAFSHSLEGKAVGSEETTRELLRKLGVTRYEIEAGWFEDTFATARLTPTALLHVDCDLYESVRLTLSTFYPVVVSGGYIILNDYGHYAGCRTATDAFLAANTPRPELVQIGEDAWFFRKP